jgi:ABC-type uncharacterized transport system auxiliary subunit
MEKGRSGIATIIALILCGCHVAPKKTDPTPLPSTAPVKESLEEVKDKLETVGAQNTKVAEHVTDALALAEELDLLLIKIEKEQVKVLP